jgi:hypothetical protein
LILSGRESDFIFRKQMGLPSGRPAREAFEGGEPKGIRGKDPYRTFKKEWIPFVEGQFRGCLCLLLR